MEISSERLREFQEAYREDFEEAITVEEAQELLSRLVTLYEVLLRPLPEEGEGSDDQQTPPDHAT